MNKADLVEAVASRLGETRAAAARAVDAVLDSLAEGVREGGRVRIAGFGSFERKNRAARVGVNPATRERIEIPAVRTVGFRPAAALKETLSRRA